MLISLAMVLAAAPDCKHIGSSLVGAELSQSVIRPGDRVTVRLYYRDGPDGEKDMPARCVKDLRVTGPAKRARDGAIEIAADAKAGDKVTLSMRIGGSPQTRILPVTGRGEQVLIGKWNLVSKENCYARIPAEIVFGDKGRYSFTFPEQMVETMTSGGGDYRWDPATGALSLGGTWTGTARFDGKRLVIEGIEFDFPRPVMPGETAPPPCRLVLG